MFRCLGVPKTQKGMQDQDSMELLIAGIYHFLTLKNKIWHEYYNRRFRMHQQ
jgi:hypothetical protein